MTEEELNQLIAFSRPDWGFTPVLSDTVNELSTRLCNIYRLVGKIQNRQILARVIETNNTEKFK